MLRAYSSVVESGSRHRRSTRRRKLVSAQGVVLPRPVAHPAPRPAARSSPRNWGAPIPITEITRADWDGVSPEGWLIGVYMSPLDVHYTYAPIAGTVRRIVYTPARANLPMVDLWEYVSMAWLRRAVDLLGKKYHLQNERQTIFIEGERCARCAGGDCRQVCQQDHDLCSGGAECQACAEALVH
jgi:hypothetical protein